MKIKILVGLFIIIGLFLIRFNNSKAESLNALVVYKSEVEIYKPLTKILKKEKNINLTIDYLIDNEILDTKKDLWQLIQNSLNKKLLNSDIDILLGIPYQYLDTPIKRGQLLSLDKYIKNNYISVQNIYKPTLDISTKIGDGSFYFLSPTFTTQFLAINKNLFDKLEVSPPNTTLNWNEFEFFAKILNQKLHSFNITNTFPISMGPGGRDGFFMDFELLMTPLEIPVKSGYNIYQQKEWCTVFNKFLNMYKLYGIKANSSEDELFESGKIAMKVIYPPELQLLNINNLSNNFSIIPLPVFEGKEDIANIRTQNIAIASRSKKQKLSLDVVKYLMGKDYALFMCQNDSLFPEGSFVTYFDADILDTYRNKFPLLNPNYIYFGKRGAVKKRSFTQKEYIIFHDVSENIYSKMLKNEISIEEGFERIKQNFNKRISLN